EDREALGAPEWVESFGGGHAAHDRLALVELLLVRRWAISPSTIDDHATILAQTFGLAGPDAVRDDVTRYHDRHAMLNAVGRCRPLTARGPRLVIVLDKEARKRIPWHFDAEFDLPALAATL